MCGIYGVVDLRKPVDSIFLKKQRDLLAHRGPDDAGAWISNSQQIGLAHRRLSIIDLSPAGHQPMVRGDGRFVIVFNGEVYNFQELRTELEEGGCLFRGGSDTEVILAAYEAWGEQCVSRFNGMFSLAIYDAGKGKSAPSLFFARDRAGKKPFYYFHEQNRFQFASELKAINIHSELDLTALNYYLSLGYVPDQLCIARGVKKLPPAHAARLDLSTFQMKTWQYWQLPQNSPDPLVGADELAERVETLLQDAVKLRLVSDVPLGVMLSGGLDSSLVVATAARLTDQPVKTFTIALPGSKLDEAHHAKCVSDYFSTEHHVLEAGEFSLGIINELIPFIDEPIADSSIIPSFMVSRLTRQHVTVALGGDGGDELFGGYSDYPVSLADKCRFGWIPTRALKAVGRMAAQLPAGVKGRNRVASLQGGPLQQMIWGSPYFDTVLRRRILNAEVVDALGASLDAPEQRLLDLFKKGSDPVDCMTRTHFGSILPDDFLVKVDRASMAHGLEMRTPFLDYRLVEFAFSCIPSHWKVADGATRRIQKILAKRLLPPKLDTSRKQGFSIPLDEWLRGSKCSIVEEYISILSNVINVREIEQLIHGHMRGRANGSRLYSLLMLGITMKNNGWH